MENGGTVEMGPFVAKYVSEARENGYNVNNFLVDQINKLSQRCRIFTSWTVASLALSSVGLLFPESHEVLVKIQESLGFENSSTASQFMIANWFVLSSSAGSAFAGLLNGIAAKDLSEYLGYQRFIPGLHKIL